MILIIFLNNSGNMKTDYLRLHFLHIYKKVTNLQEKKSKIKNKVKNKTQK